MSLTENQIATAFKSAISGATFKLDISPLQIDLSDKFKMTQTYTTWLKHFDRLLAAHPNRTEADKEKILLINLGQTGAAYFDRATTVTTEANEYINARKSKENIICVPKASADARVIYKGKWNKPKENTQA